MQLIPRTDRQLANFGIIFSVIVCLAIIALGTVTIQFELAAKDPAAPDMWLATAFYKWQIANPDFWSRATVWIGFALHNLLIWLTIYWAVEKSPRTYTETLKPVNYWALGINVVFIALHYLQTAFFYDGIAQDVPSWTAQLTVIMMLFIILAMENRRRGIFFGRKIPFRQEFYRWMRTYHGYAFSFAVIYTFWFHPMVFTWGHLLGFVQVILVMIQGSMMFTRMHLNKTWVVLIELLVLPHAALVAIDQGKGLIYMFAFGFLSMFIISQMHTFNLKPWVKTLAYTGFAVTILITYLFGKPFYHINEVIRIPIVEYSMIFTTYVLWLLFARALGQIDSFRVKQPPTAPAIGD